MTQFRAGSARLAPALALVVALAAALRALWWALYVGVIENEGAEYTRLAWSWFHGHGYVSVFGGSHILFPPLYPLLIGRRRSARRIRGGGRARRVAARRDGDRRRRLPARATPCSAGAWPCSPASARRSTRSSWRSRSPPFSEVLYTALATVCARRRAPLRAGAGLAERAGDGRARRARLPHAARGHRARRPARRPLASSPASPAGGSACPPRSSRPRSRSWPRARSPRPTSSTCRAVAGGFRWEGKSAVNNVITARQQEGLSYREAGYGLTADGAAAGPFLFPDQHALLARPAGGAGGLAASLAQAPLERIVRLAKRIANARFLGAPPIVRARARRAPRDGVVALPFPRRRRAARAARAHRPGAAHAGLRLGPLLPPAGARARRLGRGGRRCARARRPRPRGAEPCRRAERRARAGGRAGRPRRIRARSSPRAACRASSRSRRRAGSARARPGSASRPTSARRSARPRIASLGLALAHYADGEVVYLPYADEAPALRFLRGVAPDYVALRRTENTMTPYAARWLDGGLADACARELTDLPGAAAASYSVWRWTCGEGGTTSRLPPPGGSGAAPPRAAASSPGR